MHHSYHLLINNWEKHTHNKLPGNIDYLLHYDWVLPFKNSTCSSFQKYEFLNCIQQTRAGSTESPSAALPTQQTQKSFQASDSQHFLTAREATWKQPIYFITTAALHKDFYNCVSPCFNYVHLTKKLTYTCSNLLQNLNLSLPLFFLTLGKLHSNHTTQWYLAIYLKKEIVKITSLLLTKRSPLGRQKDWFWLGFLFIFTIYFSESNQKLVSKEKNSCSCFTSLWKRHVEAAISYFSTHETHISYGENQFINDGQKSVTKHNTKIKMKNTLSYSFTKQSIATPLGNLSHQHTLKDWHLDRQL